MLVQILNFPTFPALDFLIIYKIKECEIDFFLYLSLPHIFLYVLTKTRSRILLIFLKIIYLSNNTPYEFPLGIINAFKIRSYF